MAKILILNDDFEFIHSARLAFNTADHKIVTITNWKTTLTCLRSGTFDMLITDVEISDINSVKLLKTIREDPTIRDIPVLVILPEPNPEERLKYFKAGACQIFERPFLIEELILRTNRLIENLHIQEGLEGFLDVYSVADLAQNFLQTQKRGTLEIASNGTMGYLVFSEGQMIQAHYNDLQGEEAFWALNDLKFGYFKFLPSCKEIPIKGHRPLNLHDLLIRAAWVEDEHERVKSFQVPQKGLMKRIKAPQELPQTPERNLLIRVLDFFNCNAHHDKSHILEANLGSEKRIEFALSWLFANGFLDQFESGTPGLKTKFDRKTRPFTSVTSFKVLEDIGVS